VRTDTRAVWPIPRAGQETYRKEQNVLTAVNSTTVTPMTFTAISTLYRASTCRVSSFCPKRFNFMIHPSDCMLIQKNTSKGRNIAAIFTMYKILTSGAVNTCEVVFPSFDGKTCIGFAKKIMTLFYSVFKIDLYYSLLSNIEFYLVTVTTVRTTPTVATTTVPTTTTPRPTTPKPTPAHGK
jgi:hypothetical protein